jgi:polyhydroxyalkanoate synthase
VAVIIGLFFAGLVIYLKYDQIINVTVINNCYKDNLLIANKMKIDNYSIDLRNITVPLLMIDAEKDDLITTESALAVSDYVSSNEKDFLKSPGGHVALCISDSAHEKLWPKAAKWILSK